MANYLLDIHRIRKIHGLLFLHLTNGEMANNIGKDLRFPWNETKICAWFVLFLIAFVILKFFFFFFVKFELNKFKNVVLFSFGWRTKPLYILLASYLIEVKNFFYGVFKVFFSKFYVRWIFQFFCCLCVKFLRAIKNQKFVVTYVWVTILSEANIKVIVGKVKIVISFWTWNVLR